MSYSAIPKEIILRLYERYDEADIAVLADWCEEHAAASWLILLRKESSPEQSHYTYKALAIVQMRASFIAHYSVSFYDAANLTHRWFRKRENLISI